MAGYLAIPEIILAFLLLSTNALAFVDTLPFPSVDASIMTKSGNIQALQVAGDHINLLHGGPQVVERLPWRSTETTRDKRFGLLTEHSVLEFPKEVRDGTFQAFFELPAGDGMLLDRKDLGFVRMNKDMELLERRTMPWDLIKPPMDRGGEAPTAEVTQLRKRFKLKMATAKETLVGLTPVPERWWPEKEGARYLVATQIEGFPILGVKCEAIAQSRCMIDRACFVEKDPGAKATKRGIALVEQAPNKRKLLIGDAKRHQILVYRFDSCLNIVKEKSIALPAKLKELTNIYVDAEDRLWVTTAHPDDYNNASVYMWQKAEWFGAAPLK